MGKNSGKSLIEVLRQRRRRVVGLMSGTSADGLDLAVVDIRDGRAGPGYQVRAVDTISYPPAMRKRIHELMDAESCSFETLVRLHYRWAEFAAETVRFFLGKNSIPLHSVDALACHGQTIAHYPQERRFLGGNSHGTFQVGDPAVLARLAGYITVGDFRWSDIAAGGSGAPLSGYYHYLMLSRLEKRGAHRPSLAVLNIGGMANISISRAKAGCLSITAFDTGPGNSLSDTIMRLWGRRAFDRDGKLAARGTCGRAVLRKMENHPYFRRRAPKSCGKEEFGSRFISQFYPAAPRSRSELCDRLATVAELVARSIADSRRWLGEIGGLIVVGGGRHNVHLMRRISELISPVPLISCDCLGLPGDFCEAIGFALLTHETLSGRAGNLGGATGGKPAVLGKICVPA